MNLVDLMKGIYKQFINDEILLRLLYYVPENQNDNPLDVNKENILDMDAIKKFEIVDNVVYFTDKKFELDLKSKFSRINFYLNERKPEKKYSKGARQLINNPFVSRQEVVIDIYTNMEINRIDMRMYEIFERVNYLLNNKNYKQFTGLKFDYSYSLTQTAKGFVGYRLTYYVLSPQESSGKRWL